MASSRRPPPANTLHEKVRPTLGPLLSLCCGWIVCGLAAESAQASEFDAVARPLLESYCYECHGWGASEGGMPLDELIVDPPSPSNLSQWTRVWKNLRTHLMPPAEAAQPTDAERRMLIAEIERDVFQLNPQNPDPGVVTLRRLNRDEYRFSIRDWLGVDFDTDETFPPDDTGYGFDTVGDAMTLSAMLMEKYVAAAETIAAKAVYLGGPRIPVRKLQAGAFQNKDQTTTGERLDFDVPVTVSQPVEIDTAGTYQIVISLRVAGATRATAQIATLTLRSNGQEVAQQPLGWEVRESIKLESSIPLEAGTWNLALEMRPGDPPGESEERLWARIDRVRMIGPVDAPPSAYPARYFRIFSEGPPPDDPGQRTAYARRIVRRLAERAFRGPVEPQLLDGLLELADGGAIGPQSFERGVACALVAILASPRFLFHVEPPASPEGPPGSAPIPEFALAARMSSFLWRSLPDEVLSDLAQRRALRSAWSAQVDRMIDDPRFDRFAESFVGQWLQVHDVESTFVNTRAILGNSELAGPDWFNQSLRDSIRQETTAFFAHLVRASRKPTELLTADYSFLNARLATLYGIEGVEGDALRLVSLTDHPHRGGLLTQASVLIVTSNPTRTSPVKRGLFVLDNLLGTPTPPPPPNVPTLDTVKRQVGHNASMRELMQSHREQAECASCHARMDPLGLALENYNALGMWREEEHGQPLDTQGQLMTGEAFSSAQELAEVLSTKRREDFLRCLTEKMLTFALGRGLEYFDGPCVEHIVCRLQEEDATMRTLIHEVIRSVPFEKMRTGHWEAIR